MGRSWIYAVTLGGMLMVGCHSGGDQDSLADEHSDEESIPEFITLDSVALGMTELAYAVAGPAPADSLSLTGLVRFDPSHLAHLGPRIRGRVRQAIAETGSLVEAGDTLVVLDSPELGAAQAAWFKAAVVRDVALTNYERVEPLARAGIVSERRQLEAESEWRQREAELAYAERALMALGAEPDSTASSLFVLTSPIAGIVVDKHASLGELIDSDAIAFTVGNLSRVWLLLDLYESDIAKVREGMPVTVTADAYPTLRFPARVAYVAPVVDTVSRTVKVRAEIPNPDWVLKPGMFARAELVIEGTQRPTVVPRLAVHDLEGEEVVFVPQGNGRFGIRHVATGRVLRGGFIEIVDGLIAGDTVVSDGSFALKAELQKGSFGHAHD